ncbi:HD domain-containing phosphohydrolase [Pseudothermotoga sp.]|uniref:HD domain-containing phosphohydrolase n=1 Tax=Pseudothermotoga sp. TaxID=2033661 RepID=UPI0031F6C96B
MDLFSGIINDRGKKVRINVESKEPMKLGSFLQKRVLRLAYLIVTVLSILIFLITFTFVWRSHRNEELLRAIQLERDWSALIDSLGKLLNVLSNQSRSFQDEECIMKILKQIHNNYPSLTAYALFGRSDGKMFSYPTYDFGPEYDPRRRPWYQSAEQNPERYVIVKPFIHAILNEPTMAIAKAVSDENGEFLGVLGLDLIISRMVESLLLDHSCIVDETGQIIAKKGNIESIFKPELIKTKQFIIHIPSLMHYTIRASISGTYVVVGHGILQDIAISLIPSLSIFLSMFVVSLFSVRRMKKALHQAVVDPIEKIVTATKNYLQKYQFDLQRIEDPVDEIKTLTNELSDMVMIIDGQMQELKASYEQLEASQQQLEEMFESLRQKDEEVKEAYKLLTEKLGTLVEGFDEPTGKHVQRVKKLSRFLAEKLNLPEELVEQIELYTPLHDIGKVLVPKEILTKPGKLTQEEFELVKKHVIWGAELLSGSDRLLVARNIALYHHERYDGSGYPFGLKDDEIPIEAQIVGLVDVYDALRSERPYKKPMSHQEAMRIILQGDEKTQPRQFSPKLLKIFTDYSDDINKLWQSD